jgi:superkiller protein 3
MSINSWFATGALNAFGLLMRRQCSHEALGVADALVAEQRSNGHFWGIRSVALRYAQRYEQAYPPAVEAVRLAPQDGYAWFQLAAALTQLRRYDEALEASEREVELRGVSADSWWLEANLLTEKRRFEEALDASLEALSLERDSPGYWARVGVALGYLGRPAEAYRHFVHASMLNAKDPDHPIDLPHGSSRGIPGPNTANQTDGRLL